MAQHLNAARVQTTMLVRSNDPNMPAQRVEVRLDVLYPELRAEPAGPSGPDPRYP